MKKRILSVCLILMLVFSINTNAFAAEDLKNIDVEATFDNNGFDESLWELNSQEGTADNNLVIENNTLYYKFGNETCYFGPKVQYDEFSMVFDVTNYAQKEESGNIVCLWAVFGMKSLSQIYWQNDPPTASLYVAPLTGNVICNEFSNQYPGNLKDGVMGVLPPEYNYRFITPGEPITYKITAKDGVVSLYYKNKSDKTWANASSPITHDFGNKELTKGYVKLHFTGPTPPNDELNIDNIRVYASAEDPRADQFAESSDAEDTVTPPSANDANDTSKASEANPKTGDNSITLFILMGAVGSMLILLTKKRRCTGR